MDNFLQIELRDAGYVGDFSLERLIEACDDVALIKRGHEWEAFTPSPKDTASMFTIKASTPTEAVARLWLVLNKK